MVVLRRYEDQTWSSFILCLYTWPWDVLISVSLIFNLLVLIFRTILFWNIFLENFLCNKIYTVIDFVDSKTKIIEDYKDQVIIIYVTSVITETFRIYDTRKISESGKVLRICM